jgi:hypothetical protein
MGESGSPKMNLRRSLPANPESKSEKNMLNRLTIDLHSRILLNTRLLPISNHNNIFHNLMF